MGEVVTIRGEMYERGIRPITIRSLQDSEIGKIELTTILEALPGDTKINEKIPLAKVGEILNKQLRCWLEYAEEVGYVRLIANKYEFKAGDTFNIKGKTFMVAERVKGFGKDGNLDQRQFLVAATGETGPTVKCNPLEEKAFKKLTKTYISEYELEATYKTRVPRKWGAAKAGSRWTKEEDNLLWNEWQVFLGMSAKKHERTRSSIASRISDVRGRFGRY